MSAANGASSERTSAGRESMHGRVARSGARVEASRTAAWYTGLLLRMVDRSMNPKTDGADESDQHPTLPNPSGGGRGAASVPLSASASASAPAPASAPASASASASASAGA